MEKIDLNKNQLIEENELLYLYKELLPREQKKWSDFRRILNLISIPSNQVISNQSTILPFIF